VAGLDLGRLLVAAIGVVVAGVVGAWIAVQRATAAAQSRLPDDDALIETARTALATGWRSGFQGFLFGAAIGAVLVGLYLWWSHPDRARPERDRPRDPDSGKWV